MTIQHQHSVSGIGPDYLFLLATLTTHVFLFAVVSTRPKEKQQLSLYIAFKSIIILIYYITIEVEI